MYEEVAVALTLWKDFTVLNYFKRDSPSFRQGDAVFFFYWRGYLYVFGVFLTFKCGNRNRGLIVLYERAYTVDDFLVDDFDFPAFLLSRDLGGSKYVSLD